MEPMESRITIESIGCSKTQFLVSVMYRVLNMSKQSRDAKLPCQNDLIAQCNDLMIQYNQLLCLRAELARLLLSRSKRPSSRKDRTTRRNRLERAVKLNERPASCAPILLLISE
jgi:hypothetical protein